MWEAMLALQAPLPELVLRAAIVYAVILMLLRISGKRGLANMNTLDVIVMFLLAGAVEPALDRLGLRNSELDHVIRSQHGDDLDEIEPGELTPSGQLVLTLKKGEQSSTKDDVAALTERLLRIEELLTARADPGRPSGA